MVLGIVVGASSAVADEVPPSATGAPGAGSPPAIAPPAPPDEVQLSILAMGQVLAAESAFLDVRGRTEGVGRFNLRPALALPLRLTAYGWLAAEGSTRAEVMPWRTRLFAGGGLEVRPLKGVALPAALEWLRGLDLFAEVDVLRRARGAPGPAVDAKAGARWYHAHNVDLRDGTVWFEGSLEAAFHTTYFEDPDLDRAMLMGSLKLGLGHAGPHLAIAPYALAELLVALPLDDGRHWLRRGAYGLGVRVGPSVDCGEGRRRLLTEARLVLEYRLPYYLGEAPSGLPQHDLIVGLELGFFLGPW